jgi:hypothetical protein
MHSHPTVSNPAPVSLKRPWMEEKVLPLKMFSAGKSGSPAAW